MSVAFLSAIGESSLTPGFEACACIISLHSPSAPSTMGTVIVFILKLVPIVRLTSLVVKLLFFESLSSGKHLVR